MEGETGEVKGSVIQVEVARDIGGLPADLPNLMIDRQGWASLNMILTSVD